MSSHLRMDGFGRVHQTDEARVPLSRRLVEGTPPTPPSLRAGAGGPLRGVNVILAPLCGITDAVFRRISIDRGADMVVTEMISSEGIVRNSDHVRALRGLNMGDGPLSLQIFGSDPEVMGEAAAILSQLRPRFVDMNFGCPVRKIVSRNGGSAVLKDVRLLHRVCKRVVERSAVPVSAKIRTGWDNSTSANVAEIARAIEDAGVSMIAVHARTQKQGFKGKANWRLIKAVKDAVSIAVVGNGDVAGPESFFAIREETGCDAVMIGRWAIGNPWIFGEIKAAIAGRAYTEPAPEERVAVLLDHVRRTVEAVGEPLGVVLTRKIMAGYLKRLPSAREIRGRLMSCDRLAQVEAILGVYLERLSNEGTSVDPASRGGAIETAC